MPLSKKDLNSEQESTPAPKAKAGAASTDKADLTPSQYARDKVGPPPEDASDEELAAYGERYSKAKAERRWG
jgi:hypothetical protein